MTVVEAVARAQGLETGLYERHTIEMADLSRSFLIRNGERQKVDFEKLFYDGDLSQNIMIEPNDFLFFGAAAAREIYVLGEVMNPGPVGFVPNATVITAITDRGGYTDRAYKRRVLVVRGSLNKPETFIVDTKEILEAAKPDFKLEAHDIVYVGHRPWIRAEELLDEATQSFIEGFVTAFSGVKIGPFIKHPIFGD
jgi:protein involved in polysaccharide export with SLBB domain